jgi:hypothetical protein
MTGIRFTKRVAAGVVAGSVLMLLLGAAPALAGSVWWGLTSGSWPGKLAPESQGKVVLSAQNRGYTTAEGSGDPIVIEDKLPAGLEVVVSKKGEPEIESVAGEAPTDSRNRGPLTCSAPSSHEVQCAFAGEVPPGEELEVRIAVKVAADVSAAEANTVTVAGGGGASSTFTRALAVGEETSFGVEDYEQIFEEAGGRTSTQAGAHPFQFTTVLAVNTSTLASSLGEQEPAGLAKDLTFQLPPGLIGNPTPFPQCTDAQFSGVNAEKTSDLCSPQTAIGVVTATLNESRRGSGFNTITVPLFNLTPLVGEPARFGFEVAGGRVVLDFSLRTGGDYGVTVHVDNITEGIGFLANKLTIWGVPGDPRHDGERGWECLDRPASSACSPPAASEPPPLLSLPTACNGPMRTTVQADSWAEPQPAHPQAAPLFDEYSIGGLDGCNHLQFNPSISVAPDVADASTPTGLEVQVHVSQTSELNPEGLAESALRNTTVALPPGVAVNPGGADGLEACSEQQVGYLGQELGEPERSLFTPFLSSPFCPNASKIGTVEVETPLLPHTLKGAVYLASPAPLAEVGVNPFNSLVAMYLIAEDPVSGVLLKLPGVVSLDPNTGQLVSTFTNTPEVPFENLRLHFFGEARAPLGTPPLCGSYTTQASFAPWSGNEPSATSSTFQITSGPNGSACQNPLPFDPSLTAQSTSIQAGGYSPFVMTMSREDGNQDLKAIQLQMPPGLSGTLTGVALCGEAQADAGTCGPQSLIGETTVSVGLGGNPYTVTGGKVYLTGPYAGAPFGLSIVDPANAGPFHLGNVIVRARIEVDPHTAALRITSDSSGPYAIPPMIDGIPLEIQHINVTINRPGFTFNPTDCERVTIGATLTSTGGATASLAVPFQVTNCAALKFAPKLAASAGGKTSRARGVGLVVKLTYPKAPQGTAANIARVKVELPKRLPSRLTTLQKACPAAQFEANPARCPAASVVGHAKAITPIIPVPLEGPAYFVSHGGEAFPSLIVVLQGYGVTVDLVGTTFISKHGITSSTFKTVPDVPVGSFELALPQGQFSALTATGKLCGDAKLAMPTEFVAQNGAEIHRSTKIAVTGCTKARHAAKRKQRGRKATGPSRKGRPGKKRS